jgi:ribose-phosphate pyrophosphokinase
MMRGEGDILVFSGSGSQTLTKKICSHIGVSPGQGETIRYPDGNLFVRILENVRGSRVYIVQSISSPTNDRFMELLFWIDAFKRASAESVTAVIPYFSYAQGDKKAQPRVSIRARVCADALQSAGADRCVFMDLHSPQLQGFFKVPVDDLYALPVLCKRLKHALPANVAVVSPDPGFVRKARQFASRLGATVAIADRKPKENDDGEGMLEIIGNVDGKTALIVDDFASSGSTLAEVSLELLNRGANNVHVAITHGALGAEAIKCLNGCPIKSILMTDTIDTPPGSLPAKFSVVSVSRLFAEAIRRIHNRESISVLFSK